MMHRSLSSEKWSNYPVCRPVISLVFSSYSNIVHRVLYDFHGYKYICKLYMFPISDYVYKQLNISISIGFANHTNELQHTVIL